MKMHMIDGKKAASLFLAAAMLTMTVTACGKGSEEPAPEESSDTIFEEATQEVSQEPEPDSTEESDEPYVLPE
jgi:predicted small lipoprotein YifL